MKNKVINLFLAITLCFTSVFYAGCAKQNVSQKQNAKTEVKSNNVKENQTKTKIAVLKGPTGIGMANLMDKNKGKYEVSVFSSPDQIIPKIINKEVDIAAVPSNLAAILYNKTKGQIQVGAVNTLGVLYIVENGNTIKNIKDLKGKTIYSSGKGSAPEFILNYILTKNGLVPDRDVKINYEMQHSDLAAAVTSKKVNIAVLPEPFVTAAKLKDKTLNIPINLTTEWDKCAGKDSKLAMGTIIFNKKFAENNKEKINEFLNEYKKSVDFTNKNPKETGILTEKEGIMPKAIIAQKAIPKCNIVFIDGNDAEKYLKSFYKVLFSSNPKSIGGKMPDEGFYYKVK